MTADTPTNTAAPDEAGAAGQTAASLEGSTAMPRVEKHPMDLHVGDVIIQHPETGEAGKWTVLHPPVRFGDTAEVEVRGRHRGRFTIKQREVVIVHTTHRQDVIAGLHTLAVFLDEHPDVPVPGLPVFQYTASQGRTRADAIREVNRVAALLEVEARHRGIPGGNYVAEADFGPVRYAAVALTTQEIA